MNLVLLQIFRLDWPQSEDFSWLLMRMTLKERTSCWLSATLRSTGCLLISIVPRSQVLKMILVYNLSHIKLSFILKGLVSKKSWNPNIRLVKISIVFIVIVLLFIRCSSPPLVGSRVFIVPFIFFSVELVIEIKWVCRVIVFNFNVIFIVFVEVVLVYIVTMHITKIIANCRLHSVLELWILRIAFDVPP